MDVEGVFGKIALFMDTSSVLSVSLWVKIALCVFCGFVIGIERQLHKKPIDIRTSVLICLGTMTFIYLGEILNGNKDSTRVLGQVVSGIGFLGAGAIITRQGLIIGMTSASVVWVLAAVGSAIGFGFYEIGLIISLVTVFVLSGLHWVEAKTERLMQKNNGQPPSSEPR